MTEDVEKQIAKANIEGKEAMLLRKGKTVQKILDLMEEAKKRGKGYDVV
jgi:hypothetical protein